MLFEAVRASIFTLETPEAQSAQQTATELHQWFNQAESADFAIMNVISHTFLTF